MNNVTEYTSIILHIIVLFIVVIIFIYSAGYLVEKVRKLYDKSLWDTRELERIRVARQIVNGAGWFNPDECKLITIIGKNILKNNGQFDPSTARNEWRKNDSVVTR